MLPLPATADQQERLPWACSQTAGRSRGDALEPCSLDTEGKQVGWAGAAGLRGFSGPVTGSIVILILELRKLGLKEDNFFKFA